MRQFTFATLSLMTVLCISIVLHTTSVFHDNSLHHVHDTCRQHLIHDVHLLYCSFTLASEAVQRFEFRPSQ